MHDTTINQRGLQPPAGILLLAFLADAARAGRALLVRCMASIEGARRRQQARYELMRLSDRSLRDIGLERDQVNRLLR